jgi:2-iminobutanoate/2-iminopropanoate deaminase
VAPFSHAVETDGFVFVTGQTPDTPDAPGKLPDGIEAQHVVMGADLSRLLGNLAVRRNGWLGRQDSSL